MADLSKNEFGNYIKKKREEKGLTRDELAAKLCVSYEALAKWESGRRMPDFETIGNIAEKLDISIQDIYDNSKAQNKRSDRVLTVVGTSILVFVIIVGCVIGFVFGRRNEKRAGIVESSESIEQTSLAETYESSLGNKSTEAAEKVSEEATEEYSSSEDKKKGCFNGTEIPIYSGVIDEDELYCIVKSDIFDLQLIDVVFDEECISWYVRGNNKTNQVSKDLFLPAQWLDLVFVDTYINGEKIEGLWSNTDLNPCSFWLDKPQLFHVMLKKQDIKKTFGSLDKIETIEFKINIADDPRGTLRDRTLYYDRLEFPLSMER